MPVCGLLFVASGCGWSAVHISYVCHFNRGASSRGGEDTFQVSNHCSVAPHLLVHNIPSHRSEAFILRTKSSQRTGICPIVLAAQLFEKWICCSNILSFGNSSEVIKSAFTSVWHIFVLFVTSSRDWTQSLMYGKHEFYSWVESSALSTYIEVWKHILYKGTEFAKHNGRQTLPSFKLNIQSPKALTSVFMSPDSWLCSTRLGN